MARSRIKNGLVNPETSVFIPLTRMNFVAFVDAGLFAAPQFLKSRQCYQDVLCAAEDVLVGFDAAVHDSSGWADSEDVMNFPVIAEMSIPSSWISAHTGPTKKTRGRASADPKCFGIRRPVPIERLVQVHTPGPITAQLLVEDPFLEEVSVKVVPSPSVQAVAFALLLPSVSAAEAKFPTAQVERELRCIAAIATCATAVQVTDWDNPWRRLHLTRLFLHSAVSFLTSRVSSSTRDDQHWLPRGEEFLSDLLDETSDFEFLKRRLQNEPSSSLRELDEAVIVTLGRILMGQANNGGSIETAISELRVQLQRVSSEHPAYANPIDRFERGFDLAEKISAGIRLPEELFNAKTEWAHSVRAVGILLLRNDVPGLTEWQKSERPTGALSEDLFTACLLAGLYVGFTRLPRSIKRQFSSLLYSIGGVDEVVVAATVSEIESKASRGGQWQIKYSLRHGIAGFDLPMSAESSSLWAAFSSRFSPENEHPLRDLLLYKMAGIQTQRGEFPARISSSEGKLNIHFEPEQIIDAATQDLSGACLEIVASVFGGEFAMANGETVSGLLNAADEVLRAAEGLVRKTLTKNILAGAISDVWRAECPSFGPYYNLIRAIQISRLFKTPLKSGSGNLREAISLLRASPISTLF
jgi:hypothetical protein